MTTKQALIAMRELLSDPKRWTKGANARNAAGQSTCAGNSDAKCWCLAGAAIRTGNYEGCMRAIKKLTPDDRHLDGAVLFNDDPTTTHSDILRVLDAAIEGA